MVRRYALTKTKTQLIESYDAHPEANTGVGPRYNVAPTTLMPIVVKKGVKGGERRIIEARWGLIPSGERNPKTGVRRTTTRLEGAFTEDALNVGRCLIPADGLFDWTRGHGQGVPHFFELADGETMTLAGVWTTWKNPKGVAVASFSILTCPSNALIRPMSDRMPVILPGWGHEAWLESSAFSPSLIRALCRPFPSEKMRQVVVSDRVMDVFYQGRRCVQPVEAVRETLARDLAQEHTRDSGPYQKREEHPRDHPEHRP